MLPPESSEDFDSQLQNAIRELRKMGSTIKKEVILLYCSNDFTNEVEEKVDPWMIQDHFEKEGLSL